MSDVSQRFRIARRFNLIPHQTLQMGGHVRIYETICPCGKCGLYEISEATLELFEVIRNEMNTQRIHAGKPARGISISSGVRCREYNTLLRARGEPASSTSLHIPQEIGGFLGHALDCIVPHDESAEWFFDMVANVLDAYPQAGLGIYPRSATRLYPFIHIDDGVNRVPNRRWTL